MRLRKRRFSVNLLNFQRIGTSITFFSVRNCENGIMSFTVVSSVHQWNEQHYWSTSLLMNHSTYFLYLFRIFVTLKTVITMENSFDEFHFEETSTTTFANTELNLFQNKICIEENKNSLYLLYFLIYPYPFLKTNPPIILLFHLAFKSICREFKDHFISHINAVLILSRSNSYA